MANVEPIFIATTKSPGLLIENSDGTSEQTLFTASTDGALVQSISVSSDDTNAVDVQLFLNDGTTSHLMGTVNIPTLAGTDGVEANINLLASINGLQADGSLILEASHSLTVAALVTVTSAKKVTLVVQGGDL